MTPEERLEKLQKLKRLKELKAMRSQAQTAPQAEESSFLDEAIPRIQSFNQGTTLGWGDEIASYGRSALDKIINRPYDFGDDVSSEASYLSPEEYQDADEGTRRKFAEENPVEAFALELGGGFASPVNRVLPGVGGKGDLTRRVGESVARGGIEGAVAGAGSNNEDRLQGAQTGAGWGAGAAGVLTGIGGPLGQAISKRRIEADLDTPEGFKPIYFADPESSQGYAVRNYLGRVLGADRNLKKMEAPWRERAAENIAELSDDVSDAEALLRASKARISDDLSAAEQSASESGRTAKYRLDSERGQIERLTGDAVAEDQRRFRHYAAEQSVPDDFRVEVLSRADLDNPQEVSRELDKFWNKDAFKMVKDREFDWDEGLVDRIRVQFNSDPGLLVSLGEAPEMV